MTSGRGRSICQFAFWGYIKPEKNPYFEENQWENTFFWILFFKKKTHTQKCKKCVFQRDSSINIFVASINIKKNTWHLWCHYEKTFENMYPFKFNLLFDPNITIFSSSGGAYSRGTALGEEIKYSASRR
jgi:hypothetical protein